MVIYLVLMNDKIKAESLSLYAQKLRYSALTRSLHNREHAQDSTPVSGLLKAKARTPIVVKQNQRPRSCFRPVKGLYGFLA